MARKYLLAAAAALASLTAATSASAAVYTYTEADGSTLTLNTTTHIGTIVGPAINVSFTSASLATFTGGVNPTANLAITAISGTRTLNGVTYVPNLNSLSGMTTMLHLATGSGYLWSSWGTTACPSCNSLPVGNGSTDFMLSETGYTPPSTTSGGTTTGGTTTGGTTTGGTTTGGTTTGGTTTGGTTTGGTTTGGTAVPEPANELALFGLGLAAVLIGRRDIMRRKAKA